MQNQQRKALLIGAGIGGATTAIYLKRAGIEVEIYEAREQPEGYSLTLGSNGIRVLHDLGLDQAAMMIGSPVQNSITMTGRGKDIGHITMAGGGFKSVFIKRVPLGQILSDEVERQGIKITRGKKLKEVGTTEEGVIATFMDGTQAFGDLLIGCDGIRSQTRQFVDPAFPGPTYTGLINTGGYTSNLKLVSPPETIYFVFGQKAFFGYHANPTTGYIYWFANWPIEQEPERDAFERMTDAQRRQEMIEKFQGELPIIREIIEQADQTFPYFQAYTLPQQPKTWHRGAVALLGDAAHAVSPSSGQGASMALEDGIVLAKCLRDVPDLDQAFTTYEHLRRARTAKIYKMGVNGDLGKHKVKPFDVWFRNLTTPIFLKLFANPKASAWIYDYTVKWNERVTPCFVPLHKNAI